MKLRKRTFFAITGFVVSSIFCSADFSFAAECCRSMVYGGKNYSLVSTTVKEPVVHTAYKKVVETQYVEEEVTSYETQWEQQKRERRITVAREIPETSYVERKVVVNRPVEETQMRDTSYNVTRYVEEKGEREERYVVPKQVYETEVREIVESHRVPVQETTYETRVHTVNKPITTYQTRTVDHGQYVTRQVEVPGRTYNRLAWQRGGNYYDSATGTTHWRMPGLYFTPMHTDPQYRPERVYQPNYVTETVPVTTAIQEQQYEQVPVTRTTYREEQVLKKQEIQVPKTIEEVVVRKIPYTTYKPVTERVEQKTPVTVRKIVTEEQIEKVPVTTYKTVTELRVEPYTVQVAKLVPVKRTVRKPITVEKIVPYNYTVERQRVVVNRIPVEQNQTRIKERIVEIEDVQVDSGNDQKIQPAQKQTAESDSIKNTTKKPEYAPQVIETKEPNNDNNNANEANKTPVLELPQ
ncbi:MAG: hypothetical protein LBK06_00780 [Planctomycetaceae bacterium]|nr:hypothetical protein [Planctomycetaceae bacterium]